MLTTLKLPTKLHLIVFVCQWTGPWNFLKKQLDPINFSYCGTEWAKKGCLRHAPLQRVCVNFEKHSGRATHGRAAATTAGAGAGSSSDQGGRKRIAGGVHQPGD